MVRTFAALRWWMLVLLCSMANGCVMIPLDLGFSRDRALEAQILPQTADAFPEIDTLALNQEMIDYLDREVTNRRSGPEIVQQLQELLFGPDNLNLQYDDLRTRTAIETFQDRQGNCLSVVSLYVAMARHLGVEAEFQTVKVRPRWDRRGELLVLSQHINAIGRFGHGTTYVVDFTPEITLQQLTAHTVSDTHSRALYFNNLGVESLIAGQVEQALHYFRNSLWIDPTLSMVWSNIGTAFSKGDEKSLAEYSYRMAFDLDKTNGTAINNLTKFYFQQGDLETSERYAAAMERFNNRNPYYHYNLGNVAFAEQDFELAREHFRNAIQRKGAEPDFYLALSITYGRLGDAEEAERLFEVAKQLVITGDQIYQPSREKVRVVNERSILRDSSSGFSVSTGPL
ncbi:MAG: tetratricopeptide repeat protein [Pseudomonadota bacterium]